MGLTSSMSHMPSAAVVWTDTSFSSPAVCRFPVALVRDVPSLCLCRVGRGLQDWCTVQVLPPLSYKKGPAASVQDETHAMQGVARSLRARPRRREVSTTGPVPHFGG